MASFNLQPQWGVNLTGMEPLFYLTPRPPSVCDGAFCVCVWVGWDWIFFYGIDGVYMCVMLSFMC